MYIYHTHCIIMNSLCQSIDFNACEIIHRSGTVTVSVMNESEDGWLSTRNKRKISTPSSSSKRRRQSLVLQRPLWSATPSGVRLITQHSPPPPALFKHTRQTDIKFFFKNGSELRTNCDEAERAPTQFKEISNSELVSDDGDDCEGPRSPWNQRGLPSEYCCDEDTCNSNTNTQVKESIPNDFGNFTVNVDLSDYSCSEVSASRAVSPEKMSRFCSSCPTEGKDKSNSTSDIQNDSASFGLNSEVAAEAQTVACMSGIDKLSEGKVYEDKERVFLCENPTHGKSAKHSHCDCVRTLRSREAGTTDLPDSIKSSHVSSFSEDTQNLSDSFPQTERSVEFVCDLEQTLDSQHQLSGCLEESEAPFTFAFLSQDPTLRTRGVIPVTPVNRGDNSTSTIKLEDTADSVLYTGVEADTKSSPATDFDLDSQTLDSDNSCDDFSDSQFIL